MPPTSVKDLLLATVRDFMADKAERLGAALAYYATFSLAPLVVLAVAIAGLFYGAQTDEARALVMQEVAGVLGPESATMVRGMLDNAAASPGTGSWAALLSGGVLIVGATTLFARLREALNTIWDTEPHATGLVGFLQSRGLGLLLVGGTGVAIVASLTLSTVIAGLGDVLGTSTGAAVLERLASVVLLGLLFAVLYRFLPETEVHWADVWLGAFGTAVLFTLGTWATGWYLGGVSVGSAHGAAGALVAFLLWIYYSAQLFFLGAEFTAVYARYRQPAEAAVKPPAVAPDAAVPAADTSGPSWSRRLGWVTLGAILAWFFRK
ncbi:MAG: YihY family inner membrane protein [Bacteroidetes bacterium]|jgi:membrane protein|nr:YihY family inner membrane protein [Bacteroidota bacterium]